MFRSRKPKIGRKDPSRWPRGTLYPQMLALTLPTSGGRSVGIVCSRAQATEFVLLLWINVKNYSIQRVKQSSIRCKQTKIERKLKPFLHKCVRNRTSTCLAQSILLFTFALSEALIHIKTEPVVHKLIWSRWSVYKWPLEPRKWCSTHTGADTIAVKCARISQIMGSEPKFPFPSTSLSFPTSKWLLSYTLRTPICLLCRYLSLIAVWKVSCNIYFLLKGDTRGVFPLDWSLFCFRCFK
jgi:hypothetical protein